MRTSAEKIFKTPLTVSNCFNKNIQLKCHSLSYDGGLTQASLHSFIDEFSPCHALSGDSDGNDAQKKGLLRLPFGPGYLKKRD